MNTRRALTITAWLVAFAAGTAIREVAPEAAKLLALTALGVGVVVAGSIVIAVWGGRG